MRSQTKRVNQTNLNIGILVCTYIEWTKNQSKQYVTTFYCWDNWLWVHGTRDTANEHLTSIC